MLLLSISINIHVHFTENEISGLWKLFITHFRRIKIIMTVDRKELKNDNFKGHN